LQFLLSIGNVLKEGIVMNLNTKVAFMAYENDSDSFLIDSFIVENGLDSITLKGSIELTKDLQGLEYALKLKRVVDASIEALKRTKDLPVSINY
jgi:hypothetical protein